MPNSLWFSAVRPIADDYAGILIWISKTLGFTPTNAELIYEGDITDVTLSAYTDGQPLETGEVYYIRAAAYDTFGKDSLTLTGELAATILSPAWGLVQGDIDESVLSAGLNERIDLIDADATVIGSLANIQAQLQGQIDDLNDYPEYSDTVTYEEGDIVKYSSAIYTATQTTTGNLPTNTTYWTKIGDYSSLGDAVAAHTNQIQVLTNTDITQATQITNLISSTNTNASAITAETTARTTADTALALSITTLQSTVSNNSAAIVTEQTTRANADSALSSSITTLASTVGENSTAISTNATAVNGIEAKYTVKIDNNGYVSGYGLISTANNATPFSEFIVVADRFAIAPVATNPTAVDGSPFFVLTAPTVIDGTTIPAGTYMKKAFIHDATINTAKIENLAVVDAKIANLAVTTAKIADASITTAKIVDANITNAKIANLAVTNAKIADAQITNAKILNLDATKITTGVLDANRIGATSITADKIDSRNLTIKDGAGTVIFSSGTPLSLNNTNIGLGLNIIRNGGFEDGLAGWGTGFYSTPNLPITGWNLNADYSLRNTGLAFIYAPNNVSASQEFDFKSPEFIPVESNARYEAQVLLNTHRCQGFIIIVWFDENLNAITDSRSNIVSFISTVYSLSDLRLANLFATAPSNAKFVNFIIRGQAIANVTEPIVFIKNAYFGRAGINQTTPSYWTPGRGLNFISASNVSTYIASAAIGEAYIANASISNAKIQNGAIDNAKIGDAQITTAKIGTAQIDTLRVAGNAITVQASIASYATTSFSFNAAQGGQVLLVTYVEPVQFGITYTVRFNGVDVNYVTGVQYNNEQFLYTSETKIVIVNAVAGTNTVSLIRGSSNSRLVVCSAFLSMR